jgi:hypothetical protein
VLLNNPPNISSSHTYAHYIKQSGGLLLLYTISFLASFHFGGFLSGRRRRRRRGEPKEEEQVCNISVIIKRGGPIVSVKEEEEKI